MTAPDPLAEALMDAYDSWLPSGTEHLLGEWMALAARDHIAAEIKAERDSEPATTRADMAYDAGMTDAANIARGGTP